MNQPVKIHTKLILVMLIFEILIFIDYVWDIVGKGKILAQQQF